MSEPGGPGPAAPDDLLAAEHVLGVLSAPERRVAERRVREDPAFRQAVEAWERRLAPLLEAVDPAEPPASLWEAIAAELPRPLPAPARARRDGGVSIWWRRAMLGTGALLAASLAALAVLAPGAIGTLTAPGGGAPTLLAPTLLAPTLAARITGGDGAPIFAVVLDPAGGQATLVPLGLQVEGGRVPELWLLPANGVPVSLGVVRADGPPLRIDVRARVPGAGIGAGAALAVSTEPEGGSPTGAPTGPVVGQGALDAV